MSNLKLRPLLIFSGTYSSDSSLNREGVNNIASLMKKAIFSNEGINIPEENGLIIENELYVPACDKINNFIKHIDNENDVCLFYFCGHGFPDYEKDTVYLALADTTKNNWDTCGYDARRIIKIIKSADIKNYIIILDCCHSGFLCGMGDEEQGGLINIGEYKDADGAVYIASALADDLCNQMCIDNKYYVPFSYYLANIFLGKVRTNSFSNTLSIKEIYEVISEKLNGIREYNTKCEIQCKNDLGNTPLFTIKNVEEHVSTQTFKFSNYFEMTKLNVLLVKTAIKNPIKQDDFGVPLGLWMLKGYLSTTGLSLNVDIYDERLELTKCGDDKAKRKKVLQKFSEIIKNYDVIGISLSSSEVFPACEKFKIAKNQGKITFCGGIFTTSNEEYLVNTGIIDYVIPGVGTVPLGNLLARLLQEKKQGNLGNHTINEYGVASKEYFYLFDRAWVPAQLPAMRKSIWIEILERYKPYLNKRMDVYTARGCDKNCTFCSVQMESRQVVYRKEVRSVIEEIEYLKGNGITYFSFKDEDFLSVPKRMIEIINAVYEDGIKFKIRARYDEMINSNISLQQLHNLGVDEIQYGIESPNIYIRKNIKKGFSSSTNQDLINFIKEHAKCGITANCSFILGINGEDLSYYRELIKFIKAIYCEESKPKIYINFLTPHPYNSQFPLGNYNLVTKNLDYFTHKYPVCFAQNSTYGERKKMLDTYDEIVKYTKSTIYNPLVSKMPKELTDAFIYGKNPLNAELPKI